jgi:hypothetical protein
MKSRDGFAAAIVILIVFALVVTGGIAYVHYVYLPRMAAQNTIPSVEIEATTTTQATASTTVMIAPPNATSSPVTKKVVSNGPKAAAPAAFSCSYDDGTNVGIVLHASFPSYMDPAIVEVPYSGGDNAIIKEDLSQDLFCVKARKAYVDGLFLVENKKNGNGLLTVVVNPAKGKEYAIDANSTAVGMMFMNFYFFNSNPARATVILSAISNTQGISTLAQFIQSTPNFADQINSSSSQIAATFQAIATSVLKTLTATSTTVVTPAAIQITSPTGADTWSASAATQHEIDWKYQGLDQNDQENLYLYFPDGTQCNFESGPVGGGVAYVILPSMGCIGSAQKPVLSSGRYSIAIEVEDVTNNVVAAAQSDWFNVAL